MPVKPLSFKGDKKSSSKKRKHPDDQSSIPSAASKFHTSNTTAPTITSISSSSHNPSSSDDDSWTTPSHPSDLNGPTLLILPTRPPTCLASDANGSVFASLIENILDSDPRTAEPHDVRQVWVASKIAGMPEGEIGFKGAHSGWLSCDRYGILGARREARGVEEVFGVERVDDGVSTGGSRERGMWRIRTAASKEGTGLEGRRYLCAVVEGGKKVGAGNSNGIGVKSEDSEDEDSKANFYSRPQIQIQKQISISLRGDGTISSPLQSSHDRDQDPDADPDADQDTDATLLHIKMQTRFLPRSHTQQATAARHEKVSRRELEAAVGRKLEDEEVRRLKRKKREGDGFAEEVLDLRSKGKHDKFA